ncbi:MAG: GntR family transcriptional regulator [Trueperaceae bacterium]
MAKRVQKSVARPDLTESRNLSPVSLSTQDLGTQGLDLQQLELTTLSDKVYGQLRKAMMSGRLSLGQVVTLRGLATMLGTSVMPVRDAIRRLTAEGALELLPNRLIRVPELSLERFRELTKVRALLEGDLAAQATTNVTPDVLKTLKQINEDYLAAIKNKRSYLDITSINQQFHFTIYRLAKNQLQLSLVETLWLRGGPYLATFEQLGQAETVESLPDQHSTIIKTLRSQNANAVRKALADDILEAARVFEHTFKDHLSKATSRS